MFNFLLDSVANIRQVPYGTVGEKLAVGGEVTLRGIVTVFAVLILIWMLVEVLHLLLGDKTKTTKKAKETPVAEVVAAPEVATPIAEEASATPDYELIAVITAAVAAASGSSPNSFRVVSFKRANNRFAGK